MNIFGGICIVAMDRRGTNEATHEDSSLVTRCLSIIGGFYKISLNQVEGFLQLHPLQKVPFGDILQPHHLKRFYLVDSLHFSPFSGGFS